MVKHLHLINYKKIHNMVFSSSDFNSSHVSVMNEWNTNYFNIHGVWFSNGFIIGFLKMGPNLLDHKYT